MALLTLQEAPQSMRDVAADAISQLRTLLRQCAVSSDEEEEEEEEEEDDEEEVRLLNSLPDWAVSTPSRRKSSSSTACRIGQSEPRSF